MSRRRPPRSRAPAVAIGILAVLLLAAGFALWRIYPEYQRLRAGPPRPAPAPVGPKAPPGTATVYFACIVSGQQRLTPIQRPLPPDAPPARAALEELIVGEVPPSCDRPLPPGTTVLDVRVEDGVAYPNFSRELVTGFRGGSENEQVTLYAIINTLTSLPDVEKVRILVEGEPAEFIGGHYDLSEPLGWDDELIVPHP